MKLNCRSGLASDVHLIGLAALAVGGVLSAHATAGISYRFGRQEISAAYVHAFHESLSGESGFDALGLTPAGTQETIAMSQDSFALQYSFQLR